jgi:hypothetical protein
MRRGSSKVTSLMVGTIACLAVSACVVHPEQLELEAKWLELESKKLELEQKRFEFEQKRFEFENTHGAAAGAGPVDLLPPLPAGERARATRPSRITTEPLSLEVTASRAFAGPNQYPPTAFKAYGIVAFQARGSGDDEARHEMICNAYVDSIDHYTQIKAPINKQMVTVWPIETDNIATQLNRMPRKQLCRIAVNKYGLAAAHQAILQAKGQKNGFSDAGPYLLAWSPSEAKGRPDALVLVSDLSDVINGQQAKEIFADWVSDIQKNPELWEKGWNEEKLKRIIRLWADKWGDKLLKLLEIG